MEAEKKDRFMVIEMSGAKQPTFSYTNNKGWVSIGKNNDYFDYLVDLYNSNPTHGAIVKGKSDYVFGKGLTYDENYATSVLQVAKLQGWLNYANRYESWNDVYEKTARYFELFNGWAWQIIWNNGGTGFETYCMEFSKLRRSKCGKKVYYCENWLIECDGEMVANQNPEKDKSFKSFDLFNPNIRTGTQVIYYRHETPTTQRYGRLYPVPEYSGAIADIETDIEISNFHFYNLKNGMFASSMLTLYKGEPEEADKKKIKKQFTYTHSGTKRTGKMIIYFANPGETPPDLKTLTPSELHNMFEQLGKRLQQNIFTAHRADPVLFGVMTEGSLSDTGGDATLKKWDKFLRTYVELRQEKILREIKALAEVINIDASGLEVQQTTPVAVELPTDPNILRLFSDATLQAYYAKKYNIEVAEESINGAPVGQVNEHLRNITGKQWIHIKRLIREVKAGKTDKAVAAMLLKNSYALTDQDIETLFKTPDGQFSKFEIENRDRTEEVLALFEKFAQDDNDDSILSEDFVHNKPEALESELKFQKQLFESPFETNVELLKNACIDLLTGNPFLTEDQLSVQLGVSPALILAALAALLTAGYVVKSGDSYQPTEKAINKNIGQTKTETYTVYKYVTRPDVPEAESGSRPFCKRLLKMTANGKVWTREALDNITNEFGEDAWIYRGGFYTNPDTGETTPDCRHIWKSIVKTRTRRKDA